MGSTEERGGGPYRPGHLQMRVTYLEKVERDLRRRNRGLEDEVRRLKGPPLWRRIRKSRLLQGLRHFLMVVGSWLFGALIVVGCLFVVALFWDMLLWSVMTGTLVLVPGPPHPTVYCDAGPPAGLIYPSYGR